jgi:hypothetical protein
MPHMQGVVRSCAYRWLWITPLIFKDLRDCNTEPCIIVTDTWCGTREDFLSLANLDSTEFPYSPCMHTWKRTDIWSLSIAGQHTDISHAGTEILKTNPMQHQSTRWHLLDLQSCTCTNFFPNWQHVKTKAGHRITSHAILSIAGHIWFLP